MNEFKVHDVHSAPDASKPLLQKSLHAFGMIPHLHGVLAEAPPLLEAYQVTHELFMKTSFNADELTVVWQTISVEHGCSYCVPAHTAIAHSMKVDLALSNALRNREPMPNAKLQALHQMVLQIIRLRGRVSRDDISVFYAAGYAEQQLLEIIVGVSQKVISNYVNHMAQTPLDQPFQEFAWSRHD